MTEMTSRERISRMFEHRDADRIPVTDEPWNATIERWHKEGMPKDVSFRDYFNLDKIVHFQVDNSPQYEQKTIEETEEHIVYTSAYGATLKQWKHTASTPEFLDFTIKSPDDWSKAKARLTPAKDRVNWKQLKDNYKKWRSEGYWIQAGLWFGFDVTHSWIVGTERILFALLENPDWCRDMFSHYLDVNLKLLDMVWDEGYKFDSVFWCDDMGYKGTQFFSVDMYRDILKPYHKRAIDWAHKKGVKAHLHSCGNINPLIPELIDIGLDALNPLEVKAGMDPVELKGKYAGKLVFHGGINALLWEEPGKIRAEMEKVIPVMKKNGGYIFSTDHSVPSSVSLEDFRDIINLAKKLGTY